VNAEGRVEGIVDRDAASETLVAEPHPASLKIFISPLLLLLLYIKTNT
jgi:hypothetical protein